jgi:hypothetical protein
MMLKRFSETETEMWEWEIGGMYSSSCPMLDFDISLVEPSGSAAIELIKDKLRKETGTSGTSINFFKITVRKTGTAIESHVCR